MSASPARSVLLVEDNADDEHLILRALKRSGIAHEIAVARDGPAALSYLRESAKLPDVVLLDLNLPRISGLDVLRLIRADGRTARLVVVILTSSSEERDIDRSYALGANSYVAKPIGSEHFTEAILLLGRYWLTLNETELGI
jgi:CheY-like chemotaxis protein